MTSPIRWTSSSSETPTSSSGSDTIEKRGWKGRSKAVSREVIPASTFDGCTPGFYHIAVRLDEQSTYVVENDYQLDDDGAWRDLFIGEDGTLRWSKVLIGESPCLPPPGTATETPQER